MVKIYLPVQLSKNIRSHDGGLCARIATDLGPFTDRSGTSDTAGETLLLQRARDALYCYASATFWYKSEGAFTSSPAAAAATAETPAAAAAATAAKAATPPASGEAHITASAPVSSPRRRAEQRRCRCSAGSGCRCCRCRRGGCRCTPRSHRLRRSEFSHREQCACTVAAACKAAPQAQNERSRGSRPNASDAMRCGIAYICGTHATAAAVLIGAVRSR